MKKEKLGRMNYLKREYETHKDVSLNELNELYNLFNELFIEYKNGGQEYMVSIISGVMNDLLHRIAREKTLKGEPYLVTEVDKLHDMIKGALNGRLYKPVEIKRSVELFERRGVIEEEKEKGRERIASNKQ